jgi:hypothetical protein
MYKDFLHCYHPKKILNRHGDWITTSCGCCPACLARMSKKASYQCSLHEMDYKYCMFVTLTYSNDNMPLLRLEEFQDNGDNAHFYRMYDVTARLQAAQNIIGNFVANATVSPFYVSQIRSKFHYFGNDIPYLSKYDAQCFLKRFRKHLNKYTDEKVSYYLVGEYGPIHFRPHFHVLFYFDSDTILQNFGEILHSSWSLGFVDYSQSRGKCSTYVAQYVNSRNSVPRLYQDRSIRPFCLHSQKFAQRFYQAQKAEIYENEDFRFTDIMRSVGCSVSSTYAWRSLVSAFFPKCRGFNLLSPPELTYSYTLLSTVKKFYGKDLKISQIVELICRDLLHHSYTIGEFSYIRNSGTLAYLLYFIHRNLTRCDDTYVLSTSVSKWRYCDLSLDQWNSIKTSIASMLYLSSHFIKFVCDGDMRLVHQRLQSIIRFYQLRDYDNLVSQYDLQTTLLSDCSDEDTSLLYYLYDNVFESSDDAGVRYFVLSDYDVRLFRYLSELPYYHLFLDVTNEYYNRSIKHKELNDMNEIFC